MKTTISKSICFLLFLSLLGIICYAGQNPQIKVASKLKPRFDSIKFVKINKDGFLLPDTLQIFDRGFNYLRTLLVPKVERVKILSITKKMYYLGLDSDECFRGYFLEILYKGDKLIVFGKYVFGLNRYIPIKSVKSGGITYKIYTGEKYSIGAANEIGLVGCDDYSILTIRKLPGNNYSLIRNPITEIWDNGEYCQLRHDDGATESIDSTWSIKDTLVFKIHAEYQSAGGNYLLKVIYDDSLSSAIITNYVIYDGDQVIPQPDIK